MKNIDNLTGYVLNCTVARALGWQQSNKRPVYWLDDEIRNHRIHTDQADSAAFSGDFDPAHNIAQAWELDGEGYEWKFEEYKGIELQALVFRSDHHTSLLALGVALVKLADFPDKSAAYATARCRAWLKAKQAAGVTNEA